jgi:hypothetical protein
MSSSNDEGQAKRRRFSELQSGLERHDQHYPDRHARESTQLRTELVREIQALEEELGADMQREKPGIHAS